MNIEITGRTGFASGEAFDATLDEITSNLMFSTHHLMFELMNLMLSSLAANYKLQ